MKPCFDYLANPVNHTEEAAVVSIHGLGACLEARMEVLAVLARNSPTSWPAKAAAYNYIVQSAASCRFQHLPPEHGAAEV